MTAYLLLKISPKACRTSIVHRQIRKVMIKPALTGWRECIHHSELWHAMGLNDTRKWHIPAGTGKPAFNTLPIRRRKRDRGPDATLERFPRCQYNPFPFAGLA